MPRLTDSDNFRKASQEELLNTARNVVQEEIRACTVFESKRLEALPMFDKSELLLGRVVGRGGFAVCQEIKAMHLKPLDSTIMKETSRQPTERSNTSSNERDGNSCQETSLFTHKPAFTVKLSESAPSVATDDETDRERLARQIRGKKGDKYVIKLVDQEMLYHNKPTYLRGVIDLALETHYLASLNHPHILSLRGLAKVTPFDPDGDYFLILEQLQETLPKRLVAWMHRHRATKGVTGLLTRGRRKVGRLYLERLQVALDVADAMSYLHQKKIIYRDIKPDNIGFTANATLKIFDFGLARQLCQADRVDNDCYNLTSFCGAIRYMAPEVGLGKPYNQKADVYSWAMLFHYIIALEPPMGAYTPKMFIERVFKLGYRPAVKDKWSTTIQDLLRRSWAESIHDRPEFPDVVQILNQEITAISSGPGTR